MRRAEDGDYDAWGVTLPDGKIREFGSLDKAATFQERMEGQTIMTPEGTWFTWTGLTLVHRHIPAWEPYEPKEAP
jgi:hypothetical protein